MIENTIIKFLAELHKIQEEKPNSYTASIINNALPYQTLYPNQTEHLMMEFGYLFIPDLEFQGNNRIIEYFIENFPYHFALNSNQGDEKYYTTRFITNFRENYLLPQLYLVSEEQLQALESEGLAAVSASEIVDPISGQAQILVQARNLAGDIQTRLFEQEQDLDNQVASIFEPTVPNQSLNSSTSTAQNPTESNQENEILNTVDVSQFDLNIHHIADEISSDDPTILQPQNLFDNAVATEQAEASLQQEAETEAETIQQNKIEYEQAEASRLEQLAFLNRQQQEYETVQRNAKSTRRIIKTAAGAGTGILAGGLAITTIFGDLIGLLS